MGVTVASISISRPDSTVHGGAKPPSSPMSVASPPNLPLMTFLRLWKTSQPICIDSEKVSAPVGMMKNSWNASLLPACSPPLMTLKHGTGMVSGVSLPARSAKCFQSGTPLEAAPALEAAIETASTALAPSFSLFCVPSSAIIFSSMASWSATSMPMSSLA